MAQQIHKLLEELHSGGGISAERLSALERYRQIGLPAYRSEDYQRTDLEGMLSEAWTLAPKASLSLRSTGEGQGYWGVTEEGTKVLVPSAERDALASLTSAIARETHYLHIPEGVRLEEAIEIGSRLASEGSPLLTAERIVITLGANAEAELTLRSSAEGDSPTMTLRSVEIQLARGAKLRYTDSEQSHAGARRITALHLQQAEESQAYINAFCLSAGKTRNNYYCDLAGERAHLSLGGLVLTSGEMHVDNFSFIAHSVPHCTSSELFKYVLRDKGYGVFTGRILVALDAQKTQAYQNNRNLLLSPDARMQAKPQLEIYADDVKCSHGMTTGQLSEEALFYMRQRGIVADEARRMLSVAFADEVVQLVEREALQSELRALVEQSF